MDFYEQDVMRGKRSCLRCLHPPYPWPLLISESDSEEHETIALQILITLRVDNLYIIRL